jgi:glycosyltransferase involved in cell wall biosynthesis
MPLVSILLCIFDGKYFLLEQLESIAAQTHTNWKIYVSDDGDCQESIAILEEFKNRYKDERVFVVSGPRQGFAKNFLSLVYDKSIRSEYFAFCDQDDIWNSDHLSRALIWLNNVPLNISAIYSCRTRYISKDGSHLGFSALFKKMPSFRNALVQSIAGGNTMVFNQATRQLLAKTPSQCEIVSHDWFAYIIVSGSGGRVMYDSYPSICYRQHDSNIFGQNMNLLNRLQRLKDLFSGRFRNWNEINLIILNEMSSFLTNESREVLYRFCKTRGDFVFSRVYNLYYAGVYRQTISGNIGLLLAAILKKL